MLIVDSIGSPEDVEGGVRLAGIAFLTLLARLEAEELLADNSEVTNLGRIMSLYVKLPHEMRASDLLTDEDEEDEPKTKKGASKKGQFQFDPNKFGGYVVAYAKKYNIRLFGPADIDDMIEESDEDLDLPPPGNADADPWGFGASLQAYEKSVAELGGDKLDITTYSSAERKSHSLRGKDPLGKKEMDAIKKGMVMQLG